MSKDRLRDWLDQLPEGAEVRIDHVGSDRLVAAWIEPMKDGPSVVRQAYLALTRPDDYGFRDVEWAAKVG